MAAMLRSNWLAVSTAAISNKSSSLSATAARVKARTFEYDNVPLANAAAIFGNPSSARATRT